MDTLKQAKGFTLVELISTVILVGIIGTFTTLFIYTGFNGYLTAKETSEGALKAQIALDRISLELHDVDSISAITANSSINYTSERLPGVRQILYNAGANTISLRVDGGNANPLLDDVQNFTMSATYADLNNGGANEVARIDIGFAVGNIGRPFIVRIFPRNMVPQPP